MIRWRLIWSSRTGRNHRLFRSGDPDVPYLYLVDESGPDPDCCDDGPLRILYEDPQQIDDDRFSVTVWSERDQGKARAHVNRTTFNAIRARMPEMGEPEPAWPRWRV